MTDLNRLIAAVEAGEKMDAVIASRECLGLHDRRNMLRADDGSLDAALALKDALLPGWSWSKPAVYWEANSAAVQSPIWHEGDEADEGGYPWFKGNAPTPARALLLATLRAYAATQEPTP